MSQPHTLTFLAGAMLGLVAIEPAVARACSCNPTSIYHSIPLQGATGVPIDIAPVIYGPFQEGGVTLTREGGESVAFELHTEADGLSGHCGRRVGELTLHAALAPNTRYLLRAEAADASDHSSEITFTTGSELVPDAALPAPALRATLLRGNPTRDSCASGAQGCIGVDGDAQIEITFVRNGQSQRMGILEGDARISVDLIPDCVEARTRDAAGRRSEATVLCGKELKVRDGTEADYDGSGLACDDGAIRQTATPRDAGAPPLDGAPDGGGNTGDANDEQDAAKTESSPSCTVKARPQSASLLAWLSGLAVTFAARRRRPTGA